VATLSQHLYDPSPQLFLQLYQRGAYQRW